MVSLCACPCFPGCSAIPGGSFEQFLRQSYSEQCGTRCLQFIKRYEEIDYMITLKCFIFLGKVHFFCLYPVVLTCGKLLSHVVRYRQNIKVLYIGHRNSDSKAMCRSSSPATKYSPAFPVYIRTVWHNHTASYAVFLMNEFSSSVYISMAFSRRSVSLFEVNTSRSARRSIPW